MGPVLDLGAGPLGHEQAVAGVGELAHAADVAVVVGKVLALHLVVALVAAMLTLLELDLLNDGAYTPEYVAGQMAAIIYGCLLKEAIAPEATS